MSIYLSRYVCIYLYYSELFGGRNTKIHCCSSLPACSVFLNLWQVFPCLGSTGLSLEALFCPRRIAAKGRAVIPTVEFWIRPCEPQEALSNLKVSPHTFGTSLEVLSTL